MSGTFKRSSRRCYLLNIIIGWLFLFAVLYAAALLFGMVFVVSRLHGCFSLQTSDNTSRLLCFPTSKVTTLTRSTSATNSTKSYSPLHSPSVTKSLLAVRHPRIRCACIPCLSFPGVGTMDCPNLEFASAGMEHK